MYTAPNGNAVNFELILYTAPLGSAVTFEFTPDATATPSVQTLTLATASPSVVIDISTTPSVQALTAETYSVTIQFGATAEVNVVGGTFETYAVTVSIPNTTAYPNEIATTLATLTPTLQFDYVTTIGQTVDGIFATNSVTLIHDVVIQAGTILGKQCIVGANAVVRGEFSDYCVIAGIPAKIVKRYDLITKQWKKTDVKGNFIDEI